MSLESHLALYDTFVRNGYWVTATGVNDNHGGTTGSWTKEPNRFYSTLWARSTSEDALLDSLRSGRVFVGELGGFDGELDLALEDVPMGSVGIDRGERTRELSITAAGLPEGYRVEVVRGEVDHADEVEPGTSTIRTIGASDFTDDIARLGVDTTRSCFVRAAVLDTNGRRVAFTNPVVLLRSEPPRPIPEERRVT
jgi:small nuclear ribonucleoprotein (snRNP)-like protein